MLLVSLSFLYLKVFFQFLFVQMLWVSLHLLLWKGSVLEDRVTGDLALDKDTDTRVDITKIEAFFMNPKTVTRNLMVCSSFVSRIVQA